jgi:hypothetical protein
MAERILIIVNVDANQLDSAFAPRPADVHRQQIFAR